MPKSLLPLYLPPVPVMALEYVGLSAEKCFEGDALGEPRATLHEAPAFRIRSAPDERSELRWLDPEASRKP